MKEEAIQPQSAGQDSGKRQPGARAVEVGQALGRLGERIRQLIRMAEAGLRPTGQTVRQDLGEAFGHLRRYRHTGKAALAVVFILYMLSGTYLVNSGELAVVTRFGRVAQGRVSPGMHWHLPWPFEAVRTVNVSQVRREGIGVTLPGHAPEIHPPEEIQLLSGDENLLTAKAIVQYRVKEPADYLFRVDYNEDPLLRAAVKAALTELAGAMQVDALLTSGRTELQRRARDQVQETLDAYQSGLEIVSIDLQEVAPPGEVAQAFRDVASAAEEKNKLINDARGYANSVIPQARGEAERRLREAEGYKTDVANRARGEAQRFADTLTQYARDTQVYGANVTRFRLYVETMEKVLAKAKKYVVEPGQDGEQVRVRILDQMQAPPAQTGRP